MAPEETTARPPLHTLEQERARLAWSQVTEASTKRLGDEYRSVVRKAPAMIKINGLGQFLAFLLAKEEKAAGTLERPDASPEKAEGLLYRHVALWFASEECPVRWGAQREPLMKRVISADSRVYRHATAEALAYLGWLKRFAEACYGSQKDAG